MAKGISLLRRIRSEAAPLVVPPLVLLLLLTSSGCLSTRVQVSPGGAAGRAGVLVRVYADADAAEAGRTQGAGTLVELFALDPQGKEVFIQRSLAGEWGVDELAPGKYRLRVVAVLDAAGNIHEPQAGDRKTDFTVNAGQTAEVKVILKKTPTGLIVIAAITVVVLVVALALIAEKNPPKAPKFRPPPLPHGVPPPVPLRPIVVAPEIWVGPPLGAHPPERTAYPPRVTSVVPEPGSVVDERHVTPTLTLSQPVDESRVGPDAIVMLGSKSGLITGTTVAANGLLRFKPSRELAAGETVTVTVRSSGVVNMNGQGLESDFSWSFQTAE
jgi:hypothetical protein